MTNAPIRILVLLAAFSMIGVISIQVYLTSRALESSEQQFSYNVQMGLRNVVEGLCQLNGNDVPSNDPIEIVAGNFYIVRTNSPIDVPSLEYLLKAELEKRAIREDFEYGVYDCQTEHMVFSNFISMGEAVDIIKEGKKDKTLAKTDYYFAVYFPNMQIRLLWNLTGWKYTMFITLAILLFFTYALFIILKQRRLSAIQRDFVNNITHEFKTPIATLKIAAEVLADPAILSQPERFSNYTRVIGDESSRLEMHVTMLLQNALMEQQSRVRMQTVDLKKIVEETLVKRLVVKQKSIEIFSDIPDNLQLLADPYLLETVISNLLDNAFKYAKTKISILGVKGSRHHQLFIENDGPAIPKKYHSKIFEKFFRVPQGDQHNQKGFGLGLYLVKNLLDKMNGSIRLTDQVSGCCFVIALKKA